MIKFEKTEVVGLEPAIRGMRNPLNSWVKSDSGLCKGGDDGIGCENCSEEDKCEHCFDLGFKVGKNDHDLMTRLRNSGTDHRKYLRMIVVYVDITAPLYWWKEFDTYKVGTVGNSCSTMHKIQAKEFDIDDFSHEHLFVDEDSEELLGDIINLLNKYRAYYNIEKDPVLKKKYWWQMIQLLPSSYNQKRTVMMSYEVLANIFKPTSRRYHKLDEWCLHGNLGDGETFRVMNFGPGFCDWIKTLPYSELITGEQEE